MPLREKAGCQGQGKLSSRVGGSSLKVCGSVFAALSGWFSCSCDDSAGADSFGASERYPMEESARCLICRAVPRATFMSEVCSLSLCSVSKRVADEGRSRWPAASRRPSDADETNASGMVGNGRFVDESTATRSSSE